MKPVLAFLRLYTNTSLGLFWTLVEVLLHTSLIQFSTSCSLLLGERVRPVGKIYTFTCTCIRLWWKWENYHKTNSCWTHSSKHYHFLTEIVTESPKIIPYYRLSRSTWPLSNNKELLSHFRWVKPGKSHTIGSLICAKPTRRWDQSTTLHYIKGSQVQHYYKPGFSYIKVNMIRV
jgi:hypothetical protein